MYSTSGHLIVRRASKRCLILVKLNEKYAGKGMVLIGVHTPRADYERNVSNVREAIARMGVRYPVVIDNTHKIWEDYRCDLWPTQFVIDASGTIRYVHGGVGRYEELEAMVQKLLNESAQMIAGSDKNFSRGTQSPAIR